MTGLRRRLPAFVALWLVSQAAALTALVPRDCCAAHRPAEGRCHESLPTAPEPAAAAADHSAHHPMPPAAHHHDTAAPAPSTHDASSKCRLMGACDGPMASFVALLSNHGILPAATLVGPPVGVPHMVAVPRPDAAGRFQPPDAPPPRS